MNSGNMFSMPIFSYKFRYISKKCYISIHYCDIMTAEKKQAAAKQTFVFSAVLTSKRPMKSGRKRDSAGLRVYMIW